MQISIVSTITSTIQTEDPNIAKLVEHLAENGDIDNQRLEILRAAKIIIDIEGISTLENAISRISADKAYEDAEAGIVT